MRSCLCAPQVWVDYNSGTARVRAMYLIRLWRKTPLRSKKLGIEVCAQSALELYN